MLIDHLDGLYALYGCEHGTRIARKHIGWTVRDLPQGEALRRAANTAPSATAQLAVVRDYFDGLAAGFAGPAGNEGRADATLRLAA